MARNPLLLLHLLVQIPLVFKLRSSVRSREEKPNLLLVALVKDTFDAHGLKVKVIFVVLVLRKRAGIFQSQV